MLNLSMKALRVPMKTLGIERSVVQTPLGNWMGLNTQPC